MLVFLILMAQFASFVDPFIILLAIPPGMSGVILFLLVTGTTINIMSLMGVLMMTGIVVSDSILIVEFTGQLRKQGLKLEEAIVTACKVRLRPILMTTLATVLGSSQWPCLWRRGANSTHRLPGQFSEALPSPVSSRSSLCPVLTYSYTAVLKLAEGTPAKPLLEIHRRLVR